MPANTDHTIWENNLRQLVAILKGICPDAGDTFWYSNRLQARTVVECCIPNRSKGGRQTNAFQGNEIVKRIRADRGNPRLNHDFLNTALLAIPWRIVLTVIIGHRTCTADRQHTVTTQTPGGIISAEAGICLGKWLDIHLSAGCLLKGIINSSSCCEASTFSHDQRGQQNGQKLFASFHADPCLSHIS